MRTDEFYTSRKNDWEKLAGLIERAQLSIQRLSPEEIHTLGNLYRLATSDLALAQRDFPEHRVTLYLNQLVAHAHAVIYRGEPLAYQRIKRYVTSGYPQAYRQAWPFILIASLLLIIPALASGISTAWRPESAHWLLPANAQDVIPMIEQKELWTDIPVQERPYASSFIMQNNIQVAFLAFASGALGGVITLWTLIQNGLMLGGITGLTLHYGIGFDLWTFVIGHGVIELSVIMIAGGSGLMLGWAVLHPGLLRRRDALAQTAQKTVRLIIGCVPLLVIAGTIEGFLSPAENVPWFVKWSVGLGSGLLLYAYLLLAGRKERSPKEAFFPSILNND
jgi:uncharacterized membrane protein SpoIIM required for sporulation